MPVKRRASKQLAHRITPEAAEAYSKGELNRLHALLNLRPWQYSPLPLSIDPLGVDQDEPAYNDPPGPTRDSWYVARDLQALLEDACRQRGLPLPGADD